MVKIYENREEAGKLLGNKLEEALKEDEKENSIILAIPRGGIPIAYYVSKKTRIPFYFVVSKKITSPGEPEAALGAVDIEGNSIISDYARRIYSSSQIKEFTKAAVEKAKEKAKKYKFKDINLKDKIAIIVDDGVATGYTAIASGMYAKSKGAKKVVLAVPVCPLDSILRLKEYFDEVICLEKVDDLFFAVGAYYKDFHQVEDEEFFSYLNRAKKENLLAI